MDTDLEVMMGGIRSWHDDFCGLIHGGKELNTEYGVWGGG